MRFQRSGRAAVVVFLAGLLLLPEAALAAPPRGGGWWAVVALVTGWFDGISRWPGSKDGCQHDPNGKPTTCGSTVELPSSQGARMAPGIRRDRR